MVRKAPPVIALLGAAAVSMTSCAASPRAANHPASRLPTVSRTHLTPPSPSAATPRTDPVAARMPRPMLHDGRPRFARLSIPALGLHGLAVVPYRGQTDDAAGTRIQDRGAAASPYGPRGGVGPGGLGNYQVTGHRTSSTHPFAALPSLRPGARVVVMAGGVRYVYQVTRTRETSFRSPRSLAEQRAAVPGRPGSRPTRAFLTLSTCATQEDHAAGNYWADELHNPEHRIDKVAVLVRTIVTD